MPPSTTFHDASFADLDTRTLYALLRLRCEVFVVEQACAYLDLDGRDEEPGTRHLWLARDDQPVAYLRLLDDGDVRRISRVVVAADQRGAGHATRLMTEALAVAGTGPCVLAAQSYLVDFYTGFGFVPTGPEYLEDGIPHRPMRRDPDGP